MRLTVEAEMDKARAGVQRSLVPQGGPRLLTLPPTGQSLDWILAEMDRMDAAMPHADYRLGKLSGAVYRA
jgi:hypothetical protein